MKKYTVGLDFGTLSARAVLVNVATGEEAATAEAVYAHGVMETRLPDGTPLKPAAALQHPQDYTDALCAVLRQVLQGIDPTQVIGVGVDFTSCTVLPVTADGTPLCLLPGWDSHPAAYVKLWKHHAAQPQADRLNALAADGKMPFLARCGGKISSEWLFPKLMELLEEDEAVYRAADRFIEAGDWIVWQLTGRECRSCQAAGYKAFWTPEEGYPAPAFLAKLDPRLEQATDKLAVPAAEVWQRAGTVSGAAARLTGLAPGTPVAAACIDAHAALPGCGTVSGEEMLLILGTSSCHILLSETPYPVNGICGVVKDAIVPGFYAYEAGQPCVGDAFDWFIRTALPADYAAEAAARGISPHALLREKAAAQRPGAHGLLALDWWGGNRSVLDDSALSGMLLGLRLTTRPEDIYRALIEATAYGTRMILENYAAGGVTVRRLTAAGGIAGKDPLLMQIYADVTGRDIAVAATRQACAVGAAIYAAVAAGPSAGGWADVPIAAAHMARAPQRVYHPIPENVTAYDRLFREYRVLHDYFGRGGNDVMRRLAAGI